MAAKIIALREKGILAKNGCSIRIVSIMYSHDHVWITFTTKVNKRGKHMGIVFLISNGNTDGLFCRGRDKPPHHKDRIGECERRHEQYHLFLFFFADDIVKVDGPYSYFIISIMFHNILTNKLAVLDVNLIDTTLGD